MGNTKPSWSLAQYGNYGKIENQGWFKELVSGQPLIAYGKVGKEDKLRFVFFGSEAEKLQEALQARNIIHTVKKAALKELTNNQIKDGDGVELIIPYNFGKLSPKRIVRSKPVIIE